MTAPVLAGVRRIVVLRCNALGDWFMITPALAALRAAYPDAEVTLLGARWHAAFLAGRPGPVDRVVVLPRVEGLAGQPDDAPPAAALEGVLAAERARRPDLAVQVHGGGAASNPLVARLNARHSIGLRAPDAPPLDAWVPYRYYQSEVARYLEVVGLAGAAGPPEYPLLALSAAEGAAAARLLPDRDAPLVALHPGAGDPRRRWPVERFAALAAGLTDAGARVVVVGSAADAAAAAVIGRAAEVVDLTGRTDLGTTAAVLARCRVVVADDSGPLHLARAAGAATVGIYWCGNVINAAPPTRSRHRVLLGWTTHCPVCGTDTTPAGNPFRPGEGCGHRPSFVADVPLAEVRAEVDDLLG